MLTANPFMRLVGMAICCLTACTGCESDPEAARYAAETETRPEKAVENATQIESADGVEPTADATTGDGQQAATSSETKSDEPSQLSTDAEVARRGVGTKGQGYGGGIISEPVRVYFGTRERIVFQIQVPNALKTFKAMDSHGKGPQSHGEFMTKVIEENGINLPELPAGKEYLYDVKSEQLMVQTKTR